MKTKTLSTGGLWNYSYDTGANGKGKLVSVVKSRGTDGNYYDGYDAMGRVTASHQVTTTSQGGTQSYSMSYGYDLAGNNTSQVYPSGKEYRTVFDGAGRVTTASRYISGVFSRTYASEFQYAPHGGVISLALRNNTAETTLYNSRYQPTTMELRKTDNSLVLGLDYTYGTSTSANNGNVATQAIRIGNGGTTTTINQIYGYDNVNRLSSASETGSWSQTYGFDQYGNRWVSQSSGYTVSATLCPTHSTDLSTMTNRILLNGFSYDYAGNQKTQIRNSQTETYAYDSENHLLSVNSGSIGTYAYDGDGRRVSKTDATGTTVFVYNAGGQLIAEYQADSVGAPSGGGGTSYLTSDPLGSTRLVAKQDGSVRARYDYLPFGEELGSSIGQRTGGMGYSAADSTKQKFTRKERDAESGLDYFLARYYSSAQGRFTSPDEFAGGADEFYDSSGQSSTATSYADLTNPQSLNKYGYAYNNPLLFVDPDGHQQTRFADPPSKPGEKARLTPIGYSVLKVAAGTVVCPLCGLALLLADPPSAGAPTDGPQLIRSGENRDIGQQPTVSDGADEAVSIAMIGRVKGLRSGGGAEASGRKPTLTEHKAALREVHEKVGKLPKGEQGKFGSPQRGDGKKGYRLDPGHSRKQGDPESVPHINWWDYTKGKRGRGGDSGAVPIVRVKITLF